jgi:hypothetical protein
VEVNHYVRFARAIALVSSVSSAGCYQVHERGVDAGPDDAAIADVPDAPCLRCTCGTFTRTGTCDTMGYSFCCPIVGPLAPPDLPVSSTDSRA